MSKRHLTATYVGGPTALFAWDGFRLLTDPTFDPPGGKYTTGPVTLEKIVGPAVSADSLGRVDIVLLSHDHHYDNLDHTGRKLLANVPHIITTVEGAKRLGGKTVGLEPWQSFEIAGTDGRTLRITGTPARHGPANLHRGPVIGFIASFLEEPDSAFYFSGDTVWFDGVAEVAKRFKVSTAVLNLGAAKVPVVGDFPLTMTSEDGIRAAHIFPQATIVPLHYEGWAHFTESRAVISKAFDAARISDRVHWLEPGITSKLR